MESMESVGSPVSTRAKSALTPQDSMTRRAARNSRVHFDEEGYIPHLQEANPILVQVTGEELSKTIGVYLGFLQEEHKYDVKFTIAFPVVEGFLLMSNHPHQSELIHSPHEQSKIQVGDNNAITTTSTAESLIIDANAVLNGESRGDSRQQQSASSRQNTKFASNLELFERGELCQVTEMNWGVGKAAGLELHMDVTVPSTKDHHVLEDTFCIRSASVADRFVRVNVTAKIMGKTIGTPTLKDGIKCIGVCSNPHDSSDSDCSDDENEVDMKDILRRSNTHQIEKK